VTVLASVTLSCNFFAAGQTISVFWDSASTAPLGAGVVGSNGSSTVAFKIPVTPGGAHTLIAKGSASSVTVRIAMTVRGSVSLSPKTGPSGTRVTVTFRGYRVGERIKIVWYVTSATTKTMAIDIRAATNGTVKYTFTAPDGTAGGHKVEGQGTLKSKASATFTLTIAASTGVELPPPVKTPIPAPTRQPTATPPPVEPASTPTAEAPSGEATPV
jgi:hypothetical protein